VELIALLTRYGGMMTSFFTYTLKILRPTLLAVAISLSAPIFGIVEQSFRGTASTVVDVNMPKPAIPTQTTVIYKNSFFGT
jgi:hypothetical protein